MYMNSSFSFFKRIALLISALFLCGLCGCAYVESAAAVKTEGFTLPISVRSTPDLSLELNKLVPEVPAGIRINGEFCFCTEDGAVRKLLPSGILGYESQHAKSSYMREQLGETEKLLYDALLYAAENGYSRLCFSLEETVDVSKCYAYLACDDPFIETNYVLSISRCTVSLGEEEKLYYCVDSSAAKPEKWEKKLQAYEKARNIVLSMPKSCETEYEKALYLYRYLAERVEYISDVDYIEKGDFLYDTLLGEASNCDGYANALLLLYSLADIECIVAMGDLASEDGVGHAWNLAKIDGTWYTLDATYDATFAKKEETGRKLFYFLTTDRRLENVGGNYIEAIRDVMPPCTNALYEERYVDIDAREAENRDLARAFRKAVEGGDGVLVIYDETLLGASNEAVTDRFDEVAQAIDFSVRLGGFGIQDLGLLVLYRIES